MIHIGCQKPGTGYVSKKIAGFDAPHRYSHAGVIFDGEMICDAHSDYGVRFHRYASDPARWDLWRIQTTPQQEQSIRDWCELEAGAGYDLGGVFRFMLGVFKQDDSKWFCSELALASVQAADVIARDVEPWRVSPNALSILLDGSAIAVRE
jgi:uncharacterized protein YycO